ncbi:MAG: hypothetical protein PWR03_1352 [Tenuifilum sp.]|nr:hypothetical protein [Tenuifilum sp.]
MPKTIPMNIGIVVDNEFNNDPRVRREVKILVEQGYILNILCFDFNKKYPDVSGANIHRIKINRTIKNLLFLLFNRIPIYEQLWAKWIKQFIIKNNIDILHAHDLYLSKAANRGIRYSRKNVKLILDLHENYPYAIQEYNWTKGFIRNFITSPKAWLKKEREYLTYPDKIIVLSDEYKNTLLKKYNFLENSNIISFPNVIDIREFESYKIDKTKKRDSSIKLMYFGAVAERRGIFDTFEVFKKAIQIEPNLKLLIIGPVDKSDKKKFNRYLSEKQIRNRVEHIKWIRVEELPTYMYLSDILLSPLKKNPQHESGIANKIFQYLYGGKPLIVSDCAPQKNLVLNFNCGLVYSTPQEYLDCILKLAKNKELRNKLGKNGYENLYKHFDNTKISSKLVSIYKSLTS